MTASCEIVVRNKVGLHARPAAQFVKAANQYKSKTMVENLSKGTPPANAKSILSLLSIAVQMNDRIRLTSEGLDEAAALAALSELIETNFGQAE